MKDEKQESREILGLISPTDEKNRVTQASSCITIHHLDKTFHPQFTHQLFEDEIISGFDPLRDEEYQKSESYQASSRNRKKLAIDIILAPSCRSCRVEFTLEKKESDSSVTLSSCTESNRRRSNRIKSTTPMIKEDDDDSTYAEEEVEESDSSGNIDADEQFSGDEEETEFSSQDLVANRNLELNEISNILNKALPFRVESIGISNDEEKSPNDKFSPNHDTSPTSSCASSSSFVTTRRKRKASELDFFHSEQYNLENDYLTEPLGEVIKDYKRDNNYFVLTIGDARIDKDVLHYHNQVQNLALWFIETADAVDISSSEYGHWKVVYLWRKKRRRYAFVGYVTLFYFYSPCKKPKCGYVVRICQIFILPSFQRCGHGRSMCHAIYEYCHAQKNLVEITVEDPAPSCTALRDSVDLELFRHVYCNDNTRFEEIELSDETDVMNDCLTPLTEKEAMRIGSILKITPKQVFRVFEMQRLYMIRESKKYEGIMKKYRLMVKKRLVKAYAEDLEQYKDEDISVRKYKLGLFYNELFDYYCRICKISF